MTKEERAEVFQDTIDICRAGEYIAPSGDKVVIKNTEAMMSGTLFFSKKANVTHTEIDDDEDCEITVINGDCLHVANDLVHDGYKTCVLNMASFLRPGGGVENGSSAQEEELFRRTNLFMSLYQFAPIGERYGIKQKREQYPLEKNYGSIYTPSVTVFRDNAATDYDYLEEPFMIDVVTVPAIKNPALDSSGNFTELVLDATKKKICQILDLALLGENNAIVLSAFGCGAYKNPPKAMATVFKTILSSERYKRAFNKVVFAIIDDRNAYRSDNTQGNYKPFKEIFS